MGAQFSRFVIFCCFFVFLGDPSKIAVLPAWELNSGELDQQFCVFLVFWKRKKTRRVGFRARWAPRPSKPRLWHHFGGILDRFWKDLWYNFGSGFLWKTLFYLHASSFFKSFAVFRGFFFVGGHFRNSSFTCMGTHFSRICLKFRWPFFKDRKCKKMTFLRLSLFPLRARNGRVWRAFWHKLLGETSIDVFEMLSRRSTLAFTETPLRSLRTARWRGWAKPTG